MAYQRIVSTAPIDKTTIEILERVAPVQTAPTTDEGTLMGLLENTIALVARGEGTSRAYQFASLSVPRRMTQLI